VAAAAAARAPSSVLKYSERTAGADQHMDKFPTQEHRVCCNKTYYVIQDLKTPELVKQATVNRLQARQGRTAAVTDARLRRVRKPACR